MFSSPDHSIVVPSISRDMRSLYDAHFAFVWRYMAHRGVPIASIDDLVHDVFRIVREHPSRHDPARSRAVLVCMVSRQVLREFRKRYVPPAPQPASDIEGEEPTSMFISRHASTQMLDAVLENLTETQREVLLLSQGEQMSNQDIADALGVPESAVHMRLESAAKQMNTLVARLRSHPLWHTVPGTNRDARALLEAAQQARTPTDRDRERVFAAMLAVSITNGASKTNVAVEIGNSAAPVVSPSSLPPPLPLAPTIPPPAATPTLSLTSTGEMFLRQPRKPMLWGIAAVAAFTVGFGTYGIMSWAYATPGPVAAVEQPLVTNQAPAASAAVLPPGQVPSVPEPPAMAPSAPEPAAPEPSAIQAQARERDTASAPPAPRSVKRSIRREVRSTSGERTRSRPSAAEARELFAAERAYHLGDTEGALELLDEHERRYPSSRLRTDREALRAQLLCKSGKTQAARRVVLALEAESVDAPVLAAVDRACMRGN